MKTAVILLLSFLLYASTSMAQGPQEHERIIFSNAYAMLYKGWNKTQREYFVSGYILGMDYERRANGLDREKYGHNIVMPLMEFCYSEGKCMHLSPGQIIERSNLEQEKAREALLEEEESLKLAFREQERKADAKRLENLRKEEELQRRSAVKQ
jgi:hypothetical protein